MEEFLQSPLFRVIIAVVVLGFLLRVAMRIFSRPKENPMSVRVKCGECGWTGSVGKYNRRCSKCNSNSVRPLA